MCAHYWTHPFVRFALISSIIFVSSCGGGSSCPDLSDRPMRYFIEDYSAQSIAFNDPSKLDFRNHDHTDLEPGQAISYYYYGIRIEADHYYHMTQNEKISFSLFNSALACSPASPGTLQMISNIRIVSDELFIEDYPAGEDISAFFRPVYAPLADGFPTMSADTVPEYIETSRMAVPLILLKLIRPSDFERHNFTITIEFTDGALFEFATGDIYLTN